MDLNDLRTPVDCLQHWVHQCPDDVYLSQPLSDGQVQNYTWREVDDQARRGANYLQQLHLPPGSHIAILGKNSAHWIIADLAIWAAGHVSVPLYPNLGAESVRQVLEQSGVELVFVGKLDDWPAMAPGIPTGVACVGYRYARTVALIICGAIYKPARQFRITPSLPPINWPPSSTPLAPRARPKG